MPPRAGYACELKSIPRNFGMSNSIIADNIGTLSGSDYDGWLFSDGYNLIRDNSGCAINGNTSTDIIGVDPLLQPLANNGGTTETMALGAGSPALRTGNPAKPNGKGNHCLATDQIGNPRAKGKCDLGALQSSGVAEFR